MSKCNCWSNRTRGAELRDGDRSCVSSATLKVGSQWWQTCIAYIWGWLNCVAVQGFCLRMCFWQSNEYSYTLTCTEIKNVCLIAVVIVWSVETCSDLQFNYLEFIFQGGTAYFVPAWLFYSCRVIQTKSWKPIAYPPPLTPGLNTAEFPSELQGLNCQRHLNPWLMLTLLRCPVPDTIRAVSCQHGVRKCWGHPGFVHSSAPPWGTS